MSDDKQCIKELQTQLKKHSEKSKEDKQRVRIGTQHSTWLQLNGAYCLILYTQLNLESVVPMCLAKGLQGEK